MDVIEKIKIPLFPLNAVLFPGGALPLRIFEPRYLDMISECMKSEGKIGVVLIEKGNEAGMAAKAHDVGTVSYISYFHKRTDGMLGITLTGEQRFRVLSTDIKPNQLAVAEIELLPTIEVSKNEYDAEIGYITADIMDIASSDLRDMIKSGESVAGLIPARAVEYINRHNLYT